MPRPSTLPELLDQLVREDATRPLLTYYDLASGERVELSVATTENWVAKTANLLQDSLGTEPGARVAVELPVHWQAVVWALACWRAGCVLGTGLRTRPDVAVVAFPAAATAEAGEVVSLALRPMGVPSLEPVPTGVCDYDAEVLGHGDRFVAVEPPRPDSPAVEVDGAVTSHAELLAAVGTAAEPPRPRLLLTEPPLGPDALSAWLAALSAGGSLVLVAGADEPGSAGALAELVAAEQVTARL